jgi:hypothetical protein
VERSKTTHTSMTSSQRRRSLLSKS